MELTNIKRAWLSPTGEFITDHPNFYGDSFHYNLGICILIDIGNFKDELDYDDYTTEQGCGYDTIIDLENKGYVRLHSFCGSTPMWVMPCNKRLTKAQENKILDWCIDNNRKYDECFIR